MDGGRTCGVSLGDEWAASSFEAQCVRAVACCAGLCHAVPGNARVGRASCGRGILGPGERSALLLGHEEVVLVLRTSQKVSAAVSLVSQRVFHLASKPELAGSGEAASGAASSFFQLQLGIKGINIPGT